MGLLSVLMYPRELQAMPSNTPPRRVVLPSSSGGMIPLQPSTIPAHLHLIRQTSGDVRGRIIPGMAGDSPESRAISNMLKEQAGSYSNRLGRARKITRMQSSTSQMRSSPRRQQKTWDSLQNKSNRGSLYPGLVILIRARLP